MWKKMLLVCGLMGSVALSGRAGEAVVTAAGQAGEQVQVRIWGRLQEIVPPVVFPDGREIYMPDYANRYLALHVGGRLFKLDFGTQLDLWSRAEKLKDRRVIVGGDLAGERVLVRTLEEDRAHDPLDRVEIDIRGKLDLVEVLDLNGAGLNQLAIARFDLVVRACGQQFPLDLNGAGLNLWELNQRFGKESVHVTGTLEQDRIQVREVQGVDSYVKKAVAVEIKGKLERYADLSGLCVPGSQGVVIRWRIHAEGKWYTLDLSESQNLENLAEKFQGGTVLLRGTIHNDVVRVTSLEQAV
jgi:hypothetical protein